MRPPINANRDLEVKRTTKKTPPIDSGNEANKDAPACSASSAGISSIMNGMMYTTPQTDDPLTDCQLTGSFVVEFVVESVVDPDSHMKIGLRPIRPILR